MTVETSEGTYKVKFQYVPIQVGTLSGWGDDNAWVVKELERERQPGDLLRTYCKIYKVIDDVDYPCFTGFVTQYSGDRHNKKIARRLAFEKVMAQIFSKALRTALWDAFRSQVRQP